MKPFIPRLTQTGWHCRFEVLYWPSFTLYTNTSYVRSTNCLAKFNVCKHLFSGAFEMLGALTSHNLQIGLFLGRVVAK